MTAFAGIVTFDGPQPDSQSEQRLAASLSSPRKGRVNTCSLDGALFAKRVAIAKNELSSGLVSGEGGNSCTLLIADIRLDNRAELAAALGISSPELASIPDEGLLQRMFERWGERGLARCLGAFAFALWDVKNSRLVLGRDCLGHRALFFHRGRGFVAFASTLGALLALPQVPRELDEITLASYLALNLDHRRTFYSGIERVPSRTLVTIGRDRTEHRQYWSPDPGAAPYRRDQDFIERARELFDQAVAAAIAEDRHVGISASGGLDSSPIAATALRLGRAERVTCYTLVPPTGTQIDVGPFRYLDERSKMAALARMYPTLDVKLIAPEGAHPFEQDDTRFFARAQTPILGVSNLGSYPYIIDAVTAAGHRTKLVGASGNFGLSWPGAFSLVYLLRNGQLAPFRRELEALGRRNGRGLLPNLIAEVLKPAGPPWLRRSFHRLKRRDPDNISRYSLLNPEYLAEHDLVRQWRAQGFDPWRGPKGRNAVEHRTYCMFDHNQFARDYLAATDELYGFETRDPHADRRLLEFSLAVPEPMYRRDGIHSLSLIQI